MTDTPIFTLLVVVAYIAISMGEPSAALALGPFAAAALFGLGVRGLLERRGPGRRA